MCRKIVLASLSLCSFAATLFAQRSSSVTRQPDGITFSTSTQTVRLEVLTPAIIHVLSAPKDAANTAFLQHPSIATVPRTSPQAPFQVATAAAAVTLSTSLVKARIDSVTGLVTFSDKAGNPILAEATRAFETAFVSGEDTSHVQQQWQGHSDESFYGLGQQQLGIVDLKGYDLDLWQHNTNVVVPFLVSSRGYGIFWNSTAYTRFGDLRPFVTIPAYDLFDDKGNPGGLTLTYPGTMTAAAASDALSVSFVPPHGGGNAPNRQWEGSLLAPVSGDYQFRATHNGGLKVWIDGKLVMDHWLQNWLTTDQQVKLPLVAGQHYNIRILTDGEQQTRMDFLWKTPSVEASASPNTSLWSEVGERVDYYFVYGPKLDDVVAGYRDITGPAVMMPQWIFGLWQSRQRYETQQQSLDVVAEFRKRQIPFDNIVQDWQYWKPDAWGSHQFDPTRFPNPVAWIDAIHAQHAHLMISVWGKFYPTTDNAKAMQAAGYLYQPDLTQNMKDWIGYRYTFYDAFNPGARKLFWQQIDTSLFRKGIDAWWMDASEPDLLPGEPPSSVPDQETHMDHTALGTGARMLNGWALENAESIFDGQRSEAPNQRVFTLTRSGYAGQQRYAAATWSGDVTSTWTALARQIPAGLGISIAGVPYWTTDTAGYTMQAKFQAKPDVAPNPADEDEFRELNARWFEFSTFTPLLRVHGEVRPREMWLLGKDPITGSTDTPVYNAETKFDRIRYHLFPYIYSLAGAVTQHGSTIMRPLVMDFPEDQRARTLTNEFEFGPQLLIAPVLHYQQRSREVYLPGNTPWYDLWTGKLTSGATVQSDAPYDSIPVFVRAGSILPLGPDVQYVGEKPNAPITLQVFAGADGRFVLYEDDGLTFNYEHGAFSEIPLAWNEAAHTLTVGRRQGSFQGMQTARDFNIVLTSADHPVGFSLTPHPIKTIHYTGVALEVNLQ
jgi:alpha-D-xyloside xylohydrolase